MCRSVARQPVYWLQANTDGFIAIMKWHRIPLTYIARLRRAHRKAGVGTAVIVAASITVVAALAVIGGLKSPKQFLTAQPISFTSTSKTVVSEQNDVTPVSDQQGDALEIAPSRVIKTSVSPAD